jgi:hypothetical protein
MIEAFSASLGVTTKVPIRFVASSHAFVFAVTYPSSTRASVSLGSTPTVIAVPVAISVHFAFLSSDSSIVTWVGSWQPCPRPTSAPAENTNPKSTRSGRTLRAYRTRRPKKRALSEATGGGHRRKGGLVPGAWLARPRVSPSEGSPSTSSARSTDRYSPRA